IVKHADGIDIRKRGDELRPLPRGKHRTIGSLGLADRAVPVDCDYQVVAKRTGLAERADMAHVKKIEGAVGENDSLSFALQLLDSFFRLLEVRQDLPGNSVPFARPGFFCWHDAASLPSPPTLATQKQLVPPGRGGIPARPKAVSPGKGLFDPGPGVLSGKRASKEPGTSTEGN